MMSEFETTFLEKVETDKQIDIKSFLPLGIDVSMLKCLIVGGGRIAQRKAGTLVNYNAEITIISPDVSDDLFEIINDSNVKYIKGYYSSRMLDGFDLVVAATSDKQVNCQIACDAKAKGKFSCIASSAKHSNIIFPAIYSRDGITVAVHSNGKNCLKSKYTKNKIADFLNSNNPKELLLFGVSYGDLPVEVSGELDRFTKHFNVSMLSYNDIAVISTCQRWECVIYSSNPNQALRYLFGLIKDEAGIDLSNYAKFTYGKNGVKAFHHFVRLSAGLDSNLIGETEIVAQMNSSVKNWLDDQSQLRSIFELAMLKARKIRSESLSSLSKTNWLCAVKSFIKNDIDENGEAKISVIGEGVFVDKIKRSVNAEFSNPKGGRELFIDLNGSNSEKRNSSCSYYSLDDISDSTVNIDTAVCKANAEKQAIEQSLIWHSSVEQVAVPTELVRIGLRSSLLSVAQLGEVLPMLEILAPDIKYLVTKFSSPGDRDKTTPLPEIEQQNFFTKDIDEALLSYEIDMAIHSAKDLPEKLPDELCVAAITPSISPWDCFVSRGNLKLFELPCGAKVGTSSQRRAEQVRNLRPDVKVVDIRGDVPDRIDQMDKGRYDAIVLASVGLIRLGLSDRIAEVFPENKFRVTSGQGSLALIARKSDKILRVFLRPLDLGDRRGL